jgi:ketosteroid isomerase-like protein
MATPATGSTDAAVRELEEQRYRAMVGADLTTLDHLLDDTLTYTHSSGVIDTKASYLTGIRDKVWEYKNISRENERVVVRGNAALVFCRLRIDLLVRGTPRKVESNALAVWARDGQDWRLLAVHSSPAGG